MIFRNGHVSECQERFISGLGNRVLQSEDTYASNGAGSFDPSRAPEFYRWLQAVVDEAPSFIAVCSGSEHRIQFVNKTYTRMMSGRPVVGRTVREAAPELVEQGYLEILDRVYCTGKSFSACEAPVRLRSEPGRPPAERFQTFVYAPIKDGDGAVVGIFLEGFDVTDTKLAKDEVQRLHGELVHVSRASAMSTMAATLAHELNQPLTAALNFITGSLRLLNSGSDGNKEEILSALSRAQSSVQHAAGTIRSLRDIVNKRPATTKATRLSRLVRKAAIVALSGSEQAGLLTRFDIAGTLSVDVDQVQIEQVFINLMRNAAEAMRDSDRRELSIKAWPEAECVSVLVQDTGPGLPEEVRARLFQPLTSSKVGGMGLGLSICRTIIEAHGGKIWACEAEESTGGACFQLTLRKAAASPVSATKAEPAGFREPSSAPA